MRRRGTRYGIVGRSGAGLVAALLLWLAATTVIGVRPAAACTCAMGSVEQFTEWADVGFVGTLVEVGESLHEPSDSSGWYTTPHLFAVERWLHGPSADGTDADPGTEITVYSPPNGGSCGFEVRTGERVAVFAEEREGSFTGGLCSTMPAEVALAQVDPLQPRAGTPRFAVFGDFDGALAAYLDATGAFLGFDGEMLDDRGWQPQAIACRDGRHAAVLDHLTLRLVDVVTAEDVVAPIDLGEDLGPQLARCVDVGQVDIIEHTNSGSLQRRDPGRGETTTIIGGFAGSWAVTDHGVAVVEHLDPGERLLLVGTDGTEREIGRLDRRADEGHRGYAALAVSPDGTELGVLEGDYRAPGDVRSTVQIVDAATGDVRSARDLPGESWGLQWVDADHLGITFGSDDVSHVDILDATTLDSIGTVAGWRSDHTLLVDGALWGMHDGTLHRADLGREPEALVTLPVRTWSPLVLLPEDAGPVDRTATTSSRTGAVATDPVDPDQAADSEPPADPGTDTAESAGSTIGVDGDDGTEDDGNRLLWVGGIGGGAVLLSAAPLLLRRHRRPV